MLPNHATRQAFAFLMLLTTGLGPSAARFDGELVAGGGLGSAAPARPSASGLTIFLYCENIEKAASFYKDVLGLPARIDKGPIHVFDITPTTSVGLVDSKTARGAINRPSVNKPLTVTFVVNDVDAWYQYLLDRGVTIARPPRDSSNLNVRFFIFTDPEGYELEVMSWRQ